MTEPNPADSPRTLESDLVNTARKADFDNAIAVGAASLGVSGEQAKRVVEAFLAELARCPACGNTGQLVWARPTRVDGIKGALENVASHMNVPRGTANDCPRCLAGIRDGTSADTGDLEWVRWVCAIGNGAPCTVGTRGDDKHAACGYHIVIPRSQAADPA